MIAADPDVARPQWVVPERFWEELEKMLAANPTIGEHDAAMADRARTLIALRKSGPAWKTLLDNTALAADPNVQRQSTERRAWRLGAAGVPSIGRQGVES